VALPAEPAVADGVDASMKPDERPASEALTDHRIGDAEIEQLPPGHHPVLNGREPCHPRVGRK
jgi:hypothetical protein